MITKKIILIRFTTLFIAISVILSGCTSDQQTDSNVGTPKNIGFETNTPKTNIPQTNAPKTNSPQITTAQPQITVNKNAVISKDSAKAVNDFSVKLLKQTYVEGKNAAISPLSIYLNLGILANGAEDKTLGEMLDLMGITGQSKEDFNKNLKECIDALSNYDKTEINIANSLWIKESSSKNIKNDFKQSTKSYYNVSVNPIDFEKTEAIDVINKWVADKTNNKITDLMQNPLDKNMFMLIINTVYLKAGWARQYFSKEATQKADFNTSEGTVKTDMMYGEIAYLNFTENELFTGIKLNLDSEKGKSPTVVFMLPKKGISHLLEQLKGEDIINYLESMKGKSEHSKVYMPKFSIKQKTDLEPVLKNMGINNVFKGGFTAVTDEDLFLSKILHETYIKVDEEGIEAAASTGSGLNGTPQYDKTFVFDKPFIVAVVDNVSGMILFWAVVENPNN